MNPQVFVHAPEGVYGPYDLATLQQWIATGQMTPQHVVSYDGQQSFYAADIWPQLSGQASFATPAPFVAQPAAPQLVAQPAVHAAATGATSAGPIVEVASTTDWPRRTGGAASDTEEQLVYGKGNIAIGIFLVAIGLFLFYWFNSMEGMGKQVKLSNWFMKTLYTNLGKWGVLFVNLGLGSWSIWMGCRETKVVKRKGY